MSCELIMFSKGYADMLPQHTTPIHLSTEMHCIGKQFMLKQPLKSLNSAGVNTTYLES